MTKPAEVEPRPSATVVLLRDCGQGIEVLLVRRNPRLEFHGGAWAFPGGRIEPEDIGPDGDLVRAARSAAAREAREEVGLEPQPNGLVLLSRWTTPLGRPKRYLTWFFAAPAPSGEARADGGEISQLAWMTPEAALDRQRASELELPPPTFVTLHALLAASNTAALLERLRSREPEHVFPHPHRVQGGVCSLYPGDAGYETGDVDCAGPRHRLWMLGGSWRYERAL
jgi:8-oxo-dGTP pyrophosphatase MutT (NUDIX family)